MLSKDQLKDLQEVVEEQLTQLMSGVHFQRWTAMFNNKFYKYE